MILVRGQSERMTEGQRESQVKGETDLRFWTTLTAYDMSLTTAFLPMVGASPATRWLSPVVSMAWAKWSPSERMRR